jgi:hypothetical protein
MPKFGPMTFSWLNKQGVESDDGFRVQFTGRFTLEYVEGEKTMVLEGEDMFRNFEPYDFGFGFYEGWRTAPWQPPHDREAISAADRLRIVSNITNALSFMNGKAKFR